jgi:hypothetical protein
VTVVQRARLPGSDRLVWLVVGDDHLPVEPIRRYVAYLDDVERSPNTLRAYAHRRRVKQRRQVRLHIQGEANELNLPPDEDGIRHDPWCDRRPRVPVRPCGTDLSPPASCAFWLFLHCASDMPVDCRRTEKKRTWLTSA